MAEIFQFPGVKKPANKESKEPNKVSAEKPETEKSNLVSMVGRKKEVGKKPASPEDESDIRLDLMNSLMERAAGLEGGLFKFSRVMILLHSLKQQDPSSFSAVKIEEYKEKFHDNSNEELQNIIEKCDDHYIKTHPNLVHAIVNLLADRNFTMF